MKAHIRLKATRWRDIGLSSDQKLTGYDGYQWCTVPLWAVLNLEDVTAALAPGAEHTCIVVVPEQTPGIGGNTFGRSIEWRR